MKQKRKELYILRPTMLMRGLIFITLVVMNTFPMVAYSAEIAGVGDAIKLDFANQGNGDGGSLLDWNTLTSSGVTPPGSVVRHGDGKVLSGVSVTLSNFINGRWGNDGRTANWPGSPNDPYYNIKAVDDIYYHGVGSRATITFNGLDPKWSYNVRIYDLITNASPTLKYDYLVSDAASAAPRRTTLTSRDSRWSAPTLEAGGTVVSAIKASTNGQIVISTPINYIALNAIVLEIGAPVSMGEVKQRHCVGGQIVTGKSEGWGTQLSRACDGNAIGFNSHGSVYLSAGTGEEFWEMDLGAEKQISSVDIFNRTDCCGSRIIGANLVILDNTRREIYRRELGWDAVPSVQINVNKVGRYVRVEQNNGQYLQLAEVFVHSTDVNLVTNCAGNSAVSVYGTSPTHGSSLFDACDGNDDGNYSNGSVYVSGPHDELRFWEADLGSDSKIDKIQINNRNDCCSDRLAGAKLTIADRDDELVFESTLSSAGVAAVNVDKVGRFVRVEQDNGQHIQLAEVAVFGKELSLLADCINSETVTISGTVGGFGTNIHDVCDGDSDGHFGAWHGTNPGYTSISERPSADTETSPYWKAEFLTEVNIDTVVIHNRTDDDGSALNGGMVIIKNEDDEASVFWGNFDSTESIYSFAVEKFAKSIRIYPGIGRHLNLAEVEVFGSTNPGYYKAQNVRELPAYGYQYVMIDGNPACLSFNGKECTTDVADYDELSDEDLVRHTWIECGSSTHYEDKEGVINIQAITGKTGYDYEPNLNHWCTAARNMQLDWRFAGGHSSMPHLMWSRTLVDQDIQCMSFNGLTCATHVTGEMSVDDRLQAYPRVCTEQEYGLDDHWCHKLKNLDLYTTKLALENLVLQKENTVLRLLEMHFDDEFEDLDTEYAQMLQNQKQNEDDQAQLALYQADTDLITICNNSALLEDAHVNNFETWLTCSVIFILEENIQTRQAVIDVAMPSYAAKKLELEEEKALAESKELHALHEHDPAYQTIIGKIILRAESEELANLKVLHEYYLKTSEEKATAYVSAMESYDATFWELYKAAFPKIVHQFYEASAEAEILPLIGPETKHIHDFVDHPNVKNFVEMVIGLAGPEGEVVNTAIDIAYLILSENVFTKLQDTYLALIDPANQSTVEDFVNGAIDDLHMSGVKAFRSSAFGELLPSHNLAVESYSSYYNREAVIQDSTKLNQESEYLEIFNPGLQAYYARFRDAWGFTNETSAEIAAAFIAETDPTKTESVYTLLTHTFGPQYNKHKASDVEFTSVFDLEQLTGELFGFLMGSETASYRAPYKTSANFLADHPAALFQNPDDITGSHILLNENYFDANGKINPYYYFEELGHLLGVIRCQLVSESITAAECVVHGDDGARFSDAALMVSHSDTYEDHPKEGYIGYSSRVADLSTYATAPPRDKVRFQDDSFAYVSYWTSFTTWADKMSSVGFSATFGFRPIGIGIDTKTGKVKYSTSITQDLSLDIGLTWPQMKSKKDVWKDAKYQVPCQADGNPPNRAIVDGVTRNFSSSDDCEKPMMWIKVDFRDEIGIGLTMFQSIYSKYKDKVPAFDKFITKINVDGALYLAATRKHGFKIPWQSSRYTVAGYKPVTGKDLYTKAIIPSMTWIPVQAKIKKKKHTIDPSAPLQLEGTATAPAPTAVYHAKPIKLGDDGRVVFPGLDASIPSARLGRATGGNYMHLYNSLKSGWGNIAGVIDPMMGFYFGLQFESPLNAPGETAQAEIFMDSITALGGCGLGILADYATKEIGKPAGALRTSRTNWNACEIGSFGVEAIISTAEAIMIPHVSIFLMSGIYFDLPLDISIGSGNLPTKFLTKLFGTTNPYKISTKLTFAFTIPKIGFNTVKQGSPVIPFVMDYPQ